MLLLIISNSASFLFSNCCQTSLSGSNRGHRIIIPSPHSCLDQLVICELFVYTGKRLVLSLWQDKVNYRKKKENSSTVEVECSIQLYVMLNNWVDLQGEEGW